MVVVIRLNRLSRADLAVAGGKGANLGELTRLGLPVPPGFVVSAEAYAAQVAAWGLAERIAGHLEAKRWDEAEREASRLFENGALLPTIQTNLLDAYRDLAAERVAVRSSATAEDLADASFAGQHETFLNIAGGDDVLRALRQCWASLWSARALAYRDARNIDHLTVNIAVVVQRMVPSEFAGVLFTVDPVAQRADRLLIEVAPGLGEAIVSGHTTGDVFRLEREPRVMSTPVRSDQLTIVERERRDPQRPTPSDALLLELGRMALKLEAHFDTPQDIEFALAEGSVFLLQSRPITTLESADIEPIVPPPPLNSIQKKMLDSNDNDRFPQSFKPLDFWSFHLVLPVITTLARDFGISVDPVLERYNYENTWFEFLVPPIRRPTPRVLGMPRQVMKNMRHDWLAWWEAEAFPRILEATAPVDLRQLDEAALFARSDRLVAVFESAAHKRFRGTSAQLAIVALRPLLLLTVGKQRAAVLTADLLSGIHTRTSDVNLALYQLAQKALHLGSDVTQPIRRERPEDLALSEVGRGFLVDAEAFLNEHGYRETTGLYLSAPTWRNDPKPFWRLLRNMLDAPHPPSEAAGQKRYEAALEELTHTLRFVPGAADKLKTFVETLRGVIVFRERTHFDFVRVISEMQAIAGELGRRLAERGLLPMAADVYYLHVKEVRSWSCGEAPTIADAHKLIKRRRATYRVVNARWQKRMFRQTPLRTDAPNELQGIGASAGIVRARARIIRDESEFGRLEPGEVMVCRYTNPAWTPLFTVASAVITDMGGAGSHAAIVAREYGLPAVLGAMGATERIQDGDEILVDGAAGRVTIVHRASEVEVAHG